MVVRIDDDFDLARIADSGQCFRWESCGRGSFRVIAGSRCVYITPVGEDRYEFDCGEDEFDSFWKNYLDLNESYRSIRSRIDRSADPFLWTAAEHEKGIRILRQDPWEMLITFIISQNRNIPAIRRSVELLAMRCGTRLTDSAGKEYYSFPEPGPVAELSEEALTECRLGYRCRYVSEAARSVRDGSFSLQALEGMGDEAAVHELMKLLGVGKKVASCISLFGLHNIDAFPVDVWVKRILAEQYPGGYPYERYSPYNGVYQQYMFAYYRHLSMDNGL